MPDCVNLLGGLVFQDEAGLDQMLEFTITSDGCVLIKDDPSDYYYSYLAEASQITAASKAMFRKLNRLADLYLEFEMARKTELTGLITELGRAHYLTKNDRLGVIFFQSNKV